MEELARSFLALHGLKLYPSCPIMIKRRAIKASIDLPVGKQENVAMLSRGLVLRRVMLMAVLAAAMAAPKIVFAQAAGVAVDAAGVVRLKSTADQSGRLSKEQQAAARAGLNTQAAKRSTMRCISLKHLEKAIREKNGAITDEMRYLAGLLRVRYVFFYPDSGDIVIAGPAEGWTTDPAGRVIGISSGRPVIRLDDLCVALRAFPPERFGRRNSSAARSTRRRKAWRPCSGSSAASAPTPIPAIRSGRSSSSRACRAISACRR